MFIFASLVIPRSSQSVRPRRITRKKEEHKPLSRKTTKKREREVTDSESDTDVEIIPRKQKKRKENTAKEKKTDDMKRFLDKQNEFNIEIKKMELKEKAEARKERERER